MRHYRKSLVSNNVIGFPDGCLVFGGRQGYATPTTENAFQTCGVMHPLLQLLMQGLKDDELGIQMPGNRTQPGRVIDFTIEQASRIWLAHLSYDMCEVGEQYSWGAACVLQSMARSHMTVREWMSEMCDVNFEECMKIWPQLPVALAERGLYEIGVLFNRRDGAVGQERRTWAQYKGYWPFAERVRYYKELGFKVPQSWTNRETDGTQMPPNAMVDMLMSLRPSVAPLRSEQERQAVLQGNENCPAGQAYYEVVVVEVNPETELYQDGKVTMAIFCKEQLIHRVEGQTRPILGWPLGALTVRLTTGSEVDVLAETGVWSTTDDEISHSGSSFQMLDEESPGVLSTPGADGTGPENQEPEAVNYTVLASNMPPPPPEPAVPTTVLRSTGSNSQYPS